MKTQDKELLLKDLCSRLLYSVYIGDEYGNKWELVGIEIGENTVMFKQQSGENLGITPIEGVKPYLRPMSSMTEEELKEFIDVVTWQGVDGKFHIDECQDISFYQEKYDWLNVHHFDYRGLISKGLALPAPEGMYNF